MTHLSRRRFLTISAAACAALPADASTAPTAQWRGTAMGAAASLRLEGLTDAQAAPIIVAVEDEVTRLENIFSLYRPNSQLSRLNRDGHLHTPAPELLDVFSLCTSLYRVTEGAFDPTIQPLWMALATGASADKIEAARGTIGWDKVSVQSNAIQLPYPGQSGLTLNGIAQGAITDRIAALLRGYGLRDVLVDMGEITALGRHGDGQDWRVGVTGPGGTIHKRISLRDRAIATSDAGALKLSDQHGHILNPNGGALPHQALSISAPEAALADGLSTALCALTEAQAEAVLAQFPDASLEMRI